MFWRLIGFVQDRDIRTVLGIDLIALAGRVFATVSASDVTVALSNLSLIATTLATVYVFASKILHDGRLKRRADTVEAQIAAQKRIEEANRDSLVKQIAEMTANQEKMRKSLHELRNEANDHKIDADNLRDDLRETTRQLQEASEKVLAADAKLHTLNQELYAANIRIGELTALLARHQATAPGIVEEASERGAERGASRALSESKTDFPAVRTDPPASPASPDPGPGDPAP